MPVLNTSIAAPVLITCLLVLFSCALLFNLLMKPSVDGGDVDHHRKLHTSFLSILILLLILLVAFLFIL